MGSMRAREQFGTSWNRLHGSYVHRGVSANCEVLIGDEPQQTFAEFFTTAWPSAFRLAAFLTHDLAAGEDIAQDVLAKMSQTWGTADRPAAYLRTAVINASFSWNRRNRTLRSKLPLMASSSRVEFYSDELADSIARLPFRQRTVVILRYYAQMSEREIADALRCRPGTVKSLASRALSTLAQEIKND